MRSVYYIERFEIVDLNRESTENRIVQKNIIEINAIFF